MAAPAVADVVRFSYAQAFNGEGSMNRGAALSAGIAVGIALGVAMHNIAVGLAIGVALGVAFGAISKSKPRGDC